MAGIDAQQLSSSRRGNPSPADTQCRMAAIYGCHTCIAAIYGCHLWLMAAVLRSVDPWLSCILVDLQWPRATGCTADSTVVRICFTCPAISVGTVRLRPLDRVRERALGCVGA